jgi:carboxylesterase
MTTQEQKQVVLIHGFTGSPSDLVPLSEALARDGMRTHVVTLPGHDSTVAELNTVVWQDWLAKGQEALTQLESGQSTIIVALSMGAFVATLLAATKSNNISALVLLAPAFVLRPFGRLGVALSQLGLHHVKPFISKSNGPDICDPQAKECNKAYREIPVRALVQFEEFRKVALEAIPNVICPVFIGFGVHDHTVDNDETTKRLQKLKSPRVEWHHYAKSAHILAVDFDREQLVEDIARFIESIR